MQVKAKVLLALVMVILFFLGRGSYAADTIKEQQAAADATGDKDASASIEDLKIEDNQVMLPLKSALFLGLKNNLDIAFASYGPDMAKTDVTRSQSAYDTTLSSSFQKSRQRQQVGNVLAGGTSQPVVVQERWNWDTSIQKRFTPGTSAELSLKNEQYKTDLSFQGLVPQYKSELSLSLVQPLLKDFGIDVGTSQIRIANLNLDMSQEQFKDQVINKLYQIELAYWILNFLYEDVKSKELALKLANDLKREFEIRIEAGTLAPIEIYQAEAQVAKRTEELITAKKRLKDGEDDLRKALNLYEKDAYWDVDIVPFDRPEISPVALNLTECIQIALEKRPDLNKAKLDLRASNIQVKYTKNQTLPRVDLVGSIGTSGLAGRSRDVRGVFGPLSGTTRNPWSGHWDEVYDRLGSKDYYNYGIGLQINIPLENRFAKSQYSLAKIQAAEAVTSLKITETNIINEVRGVVRQIEADLERVKAAEATLQFSQQQLDAEVKKLRVGMSTANDVLQYQTDLANAMSNLALVKADYNRSLANLSRVKGTLLEDRGITLIN